MQTRSAASREDRRLQLLLIAFSFGAFFEGASGFGTPVAVTGAILIGLGFSPLAASGLSLIANTAPVAYGALGTPIRDWPTSPASIPICWARWSGGSLPIFSLIVPFWVVWAFAGFKGMKASGRPFLICGVSFAVPQFVISNFINPWIVDIGASLISMACLILFLQGLAAEGDLAVAGAARQRCIGGHHAGAEARRQRKALPRASFGARCCRGSSFAS